MQTLTETQDKDLIANAFDRTYNLAIDHAIETVTRYFSSAPDQGLIEKLKALKS